MTRRPQPDQGFLWRFLRWSPVHPADVFARVWCTRCGAQSFGTYRDMCEDGWHGSDRGSEYLCPSCSAIERAA